jgi:Tfp pilus assembly protein PilF
MGARIDSLLGLLGQGRDSALLRYSLGTEYLAVADPASAAEQLGRAVSQDPEYSAAWKSLGRALALLGDTDGAADAWRRGIEVSDRRGDVQAAKEMRVFLRRVGRPNQGESGDAES